MTQRAALSASPTREQASAVPDTVREATPPRSQGPEDLRLTERVERALNATGYGPLRGIAVTVEARLVTLEGRVPSYFLKQVAQATALAVPGAHQVRNDLAVGRPG
jgi:osmotically-inducible protein OsmY